MAKQPIKIDAVTGNRLYTPSQKLATTCGVGCTYVAGEFSSTGASTVVRSSASYNLDTSAWEFKPTTMNFSEFAGVMDLERVTNYAGEIFAGRLYAAGDTTSEHPTPNTTISSPLRYWDPANNWWVHDVSVMDLVLPNFAQHVQAATIHNLLVFDDGFGGGPALYMAARVVNTNQLPDPLIPPFVYFVFRTYDNSPSGFIWNPLPFSDQATLTGTAVWSLVVWNNELYALGEFPLGGIAKWDGAAFVPLGTGLTASGTWVNSHVFHAAGTSGSSGKLYVTGLFDNAGGALVENKARWTGTAWEEIPGATNSPANHYDDGIGNPFEHFVHIHDWGLGGGEVVLFGGANSVTPATDVFGNPVHDDPGIRVLEFSEVTNEWKLIGDSFSMLRGESLSPFGGSGGWFSTAVSNGTELIVGGGFGYRGLTVTERIRIFFTGVNPPRWSTIGAGEADSDVFDVISAPLSPASAPQLIAVGAFSVIGNVPANKAAAYDGGSNTWAALNLPQTYGDAYTVEFDRHNSLVEVGGDSDIIKSWNNNQWFDTPDLLGSNSQVFKLFSPIHPIPNIPENSGSRTMFIGGNIASAQVTEVHNIQTVNGIVMRGWNNLNAGDPNLPAFGSLEGLMGGVVKGQNGTGPPGVVNAIAEFFDPLVGEWTIIIGGDFGSVFVGDTTVTPSNPGTILNNLAILKIGQAPSNPDGIYVTWKPIFVFDSNPDNIGPNNVGVVNGSVESISATTDGLYIYVFGHFTAYGTATPTPTSSYRVRLNYTPDPGNLGRDTYFFDNMTSPTTQNKPVMASATDPFGGTTIPTPFTLVAYDGTPSPTIITIPPPGDSTILGVSGTTSGEIGSPEFQYPPSIVNSRFFGGVNNMRFITDAGISLPDVGGNGVLAVCGDMTSAVPLQTPEQSTFRLKKDPVDGYVTDHLAGGVGPRVMNVGPPDFLRADFVYDLKIRNLPANVVVDPLSNQLLVSGQFGILADQYNYGVAEITPAGAWAPLNEGFISTTSLEFGDAAQSMVVAPPGFLGYPNAVIFGGAMVAAINDHTKDSGVVRAFNCALWDGTLWHTVRDANDNIVLGPQIEFGRDTAAPPRIDLIKAILFYNGNLYAMDGAIGFEGGPGGSLVGAYIARFDTALNGWVPYDDIIADSPAIISDAVATPAGIFLSGQGFFLDVSVIPVSERSGLMFTNAPGSWQSIAPRDSATSFRIQSITSVTYIPTGIMQGLYIHDESGGTVEQSNRPQGTPYSTIYRSTNNGSTWSEFGVTAHTGVDNSFIVRIRPVVIDGIGVTLGFVGSLRGGMDNAAYYDPNIGDFVAVPSVRDDSANSQLPVSLSVLSCPAGFSSIVSCEEAVIGGIFQPFSVPITTGGALQAFPAGGTNDYVWSALTN